MKPPHTVFQDRRFRQSALRLIVLWIAVAVAIINAGRSLFASKGAATQSDAATQLRISETAIQGALKQ